MDGVAVEQRQAEGRVPVSSRAVAGVLTLVGLGGAAARALQWRLSGVSPLVTARKEMGTSPLKAAEN